MAPTADWTRLAAYVKTRRDELGYSRQDVKDKGGPSQATLFKIEQGTGSSHKPHVVKSLEASLRWREGSVAAILRGGEPTSLGGVVVEDPEHPERIIVVDVVDGLLQLTPDEQLMIRDLVNAALERKRRAND